jgi:uncharacterized membrane protein
MSSTTPEGAGGAPVVKVVAATFGTEQEAETAKARLIANKDAVGNMAVVSADAQGKVKFKESGDMGAGKGALIGGGVGLVLALFAGPLGILGGAAGGALVAKLHDAGFDDSQLKGLGEDLAPGSAAIVAIVPEAAVTAVETDLQGAGASRVVVKEVGFDLANMLDDEAASAGITPETATETAVAAGSAPATTPPSS